MERCAVLIVAVTAMLTTAACDSDITDSESPYLRASMKALSTELITNGDFSAGATGWYLGQYGGSSSGAVSSEKYVISVSTAGSEWWHAQFQQGGLPLEQGKSYMFSFDAYKGSENSGTQIMEINIGENGGDYTGYFNGYDKEIILSSTAAHYEYTFEMREPDDAAARVEFNCGKYTGTYHLDNVSLVEVTEAGLDIDPSSPALTAGENETVTREITLTNTGNTQVSWSASASTPWLSASPSAGSIAAKSATTVTMTADTSGLSTGTYSGSLSITHDAVAPASPIAVSVNLTVQPPYEPTGPYLIDPDLAIDFVEDIAAFRAQARDDVNGGFYTFIDRQGNPTGENLKSLCGQSRLGYAFTRAFMLTGDESYLDLAHHALKFLYDHGYNNGWYFVTDAAGNYVSHWGHDNWWSFQQHYALLGIAAMVEATGGNTDWGDGSQTDGDWLNTGVNNNYTNLWDATEGADGYFEYASTDWRNKWDKGFTPTVDGMTTHALLLAMMTDNAQHDARLFDLADNIMDHMVGNMSISAVGFPEYFDTAWTVDYSYGYTDIGHLYKASWVLQRAYLMDTSRTEYHTAAQTIMWDLWNGGAYDTTNGGPYSALQWQSGTVTNTNKNHWMLEQGVTSGLVNYYAATTQSDKDMYLEVADGSLSFFMNHLVDAVYGETYSDVSADGGAVVTADKGGLFTAGYHSAELGYYVYLYGNLFYQGVPVTLYYRYPSESTTQSYKLTPVAIENDVLKILAVEKDGATYSNFNSDTRTLTIPAGTGGVFRVTFGFHTACGDGVCSADESCDTCEADCGTCPANNCTCPSGCDALTTSAVPLIADGVNDTCYFLDTIGAYINNWNNIQVNINGIDITNGYMGFWSYPSKIDGGYYIYHRGSFPWSHLEAR